jgi:hypothetical protein
VTCATADDDNDGITDGVDNCVFVGESRAKTDTADRRIGDACDTNTDSDG